MKNWSVVYKTSFLARAEIVRGVLKERGIETVIVNKKDSSIHFNHGLIEVQALQTEVLSAKNIIDNEISFK